MQQRQARPWLQPDLLYRLIGPAKEHDACLKILHNVSNSTIRSRRIQYQREKREKLTVQKDDEVLGE